MIDSAVGVDMIREMGAIWTFDVPSGERKRTPMAARLEPARQHGSKATAGSNFNLETRPTRPGGRVVAGPPGGTEGRQLLLFDSSP